MKLLKTLLLISVTFIFSGCYFLDYVIPEEYIATDDYYFEEEDYYDYNPKFIWISHPIGIQCGNKFFSSLEEAERYLNNNEIFTFDSYEKISSQRKKCGFPTELRYYFEIMNYDVRKAISLGWASPYRRVVHAGNQPEQ